MHSATTQRVCRSIPFGELGSFSTLFATYCRDYPGLASFYSGDYRTVEARVAAARVAADHPRPRDEVADVLADQNRRWGEDTRAGAHIEMLRRSEAVAVVTGQQVGVAGGPLYALYKALSALWWASRIAEETGRPVVPVFWLADEDHDFPEVASTVLLRDNEPIEIRYTPEAPPAGPVGRHLLTDEVDNFTADLESALRTTEFTGSLLSSLRAEYASGVRMVDAFARWMRHLLKGSGLVFLSPDDARLKRLAVPFLQGAVANGGEIDRRVSGVSDILAIDFHTQIHSRAINLFYMPGDARLRIEREGDLLRIEGREEALTEEALLAEIARNPERFSTNVVLRPVLQDLLLPTVAYVGGPAEVAYLGQLKEVYDWAGIPMPLVIPRVSATLLERKTASVMDRLEIRFEDLEEQPEKLFDTAVRKQMLPDMGPRFDEAAALVASAMDAVRPAVIDIDATLEQTLEATHTAISREIEKLLTRVVRAEKRRNDELRDQIGRILHHTMPGGHLQERSLSALYFLNKYGPPFFDELAAALQHDVFEHQVIEVGHLLPQ
jgi:bacillithiol synthase